MSTACRDNFTLFILNVFEKAGPFPCSLRWITGAFGVEIRLYQSGEDLVFVLVFAFKEGKEFHIFLYISRLQIVFQRWRWPGLSVCTKNPCGATSSPGGYSLSVPIYFRCTQ